MGGFSRTIRSGRIDNSSETSPAANGFSSASDHSHANLSDLDRISVDPGPLLVDKQSSTPFVVPLIEEEW